MTTGGTSAAKPKFKIAHMERTGVLAFRIAEAAGISRRIRPTLRYPPIEWLDVGTSWIVCDAERELRERRPVRKIVMSGLLALVVLAVGGGNAVPTAAAPLATLRQGTSAAAFVISGRISCGTPNSCLAIADNDNQSGQTQVVMAWNGTAWRSVAMPRPKPTVARVYLAGVSCKSASACVVVGAYVTLAGRGAERPYALTWNGRSLSPTAAPPVPKGGGATSLTGVSCITTTTICIAVGDSQGGVGPLIVETWNGAKWTLQTARIPGGARSTYPGAVSCHFTRFCVVAGESYASLHGAPAMLLARWNGKGFTVMKAPVPAGAANITLNDISCPSATFCGVAGFSANSSGKRDFGFAEMWNGKSWTVAKVAAPNGNAASFLFGISCRPSGFCVAVGSEGPSTAARATALSYNGKKWTAQNVPGPGAGKSSDFFGVNCLRDNQCTAIGEIVSPGTATATPLGGLWKGSSWRLVPA